MPRRLIRELAKRIFEEDSIRIVNSMDIIGDIAIIKAEDIDPEKLNLFGEKLLEELRYIKVVLRQTTPVEGEYRLRRFQHIAGEDRRETLYKEHGIKIKVDVERVYFTPRLSTERKRIMQLVKEGESICNMFAGAGPYSILIAKYRNPRIIHSIDINKYAIDYHLENNYLNKVEDKIVLYRGDAAKMIMKYIGGSVDRVLMPLPEKALDYLEYALEALRGEGYLHVYLHIPYEETWKEALIKGRETVIQSLEGRCYILEVNAHKVREVGPRLMQVCVDTRIRKKNDASTT